MDFDAAKKIYFMGIGGSSMSSLAQIMQQRGRDVCGSDMQQSGYTETLQKKGIRCYIGHDPANIISEKPDLLVKTDAIAPTNPELCQAEKMGIPVCRRAELLGYILDGYRKTVGVAGTNGKTTTSSMLTAIFLASSFDTSAIIGGKIKQLGQSYVIGKTNELCVFESCEYKESYLYFRPDISVILNISNDHMEYFKTTDNLLHSFRRYCDNTKKGGTLILNSDDKNSMDMIALRPFGENIVTFGENSGDFRVSNLVCDKGLYSFDVWLREEMLGRFSLSIPGRHNVLNAAAAIAAAYTVGVDMETIGAALKAFKGVGRRFEYHCTVNGAVVADDYAHHPDAYRVTFQTARELGFKRIIAIHQPHTFSRTKMLMEEFVEVLSTVDKVLIPPICPARETNDAYHIDARDVVDRLPNAEYMPDFEHIADRVKELAQPGDIFITLSCGDIYKAAELITKKYGEEIF